MMSHEVSLYKSLPFESNSWLWCSSLKCDMDVPCDILSQDVTGFKFLSWFNPRRPRTVPLRPIWVRSESDLSPVCPCHRSRDVLSSSHACYALRWVRHLLHLAPCLHHIKGGGDESCGRSRDWTGHQGHQRRLISRVLQKASPKTW